MPRQEQCSLTKCFWIPTLPNVGDDVFDRCCDPSLHRGESRNDILGYRSRKDIWVDNEKFWDIVMFHLRMNALEIKESETARQTVNSC